MTGLRAADEMIAACRDAGVKLMYAEEICFAPKYVRAKELADEGALGDVYLVGQSEQHCVPRSDWFWDPELAGGQHLPDLQQVRYRCHVSARAHHPADPHRAAHHPAPRGVQGPHRKGEDTESTRSGHTTSWPCASAFGDALARRDAREADVPVH
jgi:hypothetical protein